MIYVALFLLSSLWFVSLAIDMGKITVTKTELQRAADAAALAGASAINYSNGSLMQDSARVRATYFAGQNTALQTTSEPVSIDPQNDIVFLDANTIQVTARRQAGSGNAMTTIFAQTLGITSVDLKAVATAKAIPVTEPCQHLASMAPIAKPGGYSTSCDSLVDLKVGAGGSSSGNFQLLDFGSDCTEPPCDGINGIGPLTRCWLANGFGCCVKIGDTFVDTAPGNKVGPAKTGLTDRWKADTDQTEGICYDKYKGNGERVVPCPIVDTWDVNGKKNAKIVGFAAFFLVSKPQGGGAGSFAKGQFINYIVPGESDGTTPVGPQLFTVRLVPNQT
jgi:Flp pilus assembly protein TadG